MSKYIIDIPNGIEWGVVTCRTEDGFYTRDFDSLEELNSDYINEHFGDLQDTAYKKGLHDGESKCGYCNEYQRGLDDAWECMKKIAFLEKPRDMRDFLGHTTFGGILTGYTAAEAIAKLKAYEEKQKADDKIEVGDEVEWDNDFTGDRFIVTRIYQPYGKKEQCDGIDDDGDVYRAVLIESLVKTGRHFDIASILEDMRND